MTGPSPRPDLTSLFTLPPLREIDYTWPPAAAYASAGSELLPDGLVLHEEIQQLLTASPGRIAAFRHGRACARLGMRALGFSDAPILRGPGREPAWPAGVSGSITHTAGFVAAIVLASEPSDGLAVGIDAERIERQGRDVLRRILTDGEFDTIGSSDSARTEAIRIFSAKEAFYKAQHQLTRQWVGFQDVSTRDVSTRDVSGRPGPEHGQKAELCLELSPATDLAALALVRWPVLVRQVLIDTAHGPVVVSGTCVVVAHPTDS